MNKWNRLFVSFALEQYFFLHVSLETKIKSEAFCTSGNLDAKNIATL
jgi:hypothetical protein